MKKQILWRIFLSSIAAIFILTGLQTAIGEDTPSPGRYKTLSSSSGQYTETYMLDKQSGRVWMLRGQVSEAPYLIACVYQLLNGGTALSPLDEGTQSETTEDRFVIKSAPNSQYAETYVLDKQNGRVWMMRGQVSQGPYLIPCVFLLSGTNTALSPLTSFLPKDRFSMTCAASGSYSETYVNDIETGSLWKMRGQASKSPYLIPCIYQLVNGENASIPMERQSEIRLLTKHASSRDTQGNFNSSAQNISAPDSKLPPEMQKKLDEESRKADEDMKKLFPK